MVKAMVTPRIVSAIALTLTKELALSTHIRVRR